MTPAEISETYFTAWEAGDFDTMGTLLAPDVDFVGTLGTARGAEECLQGLKRMGQMLERIEVHARVATDTDVITWFDLYVPGAPVTPTANWSHVEDGKITRIRVAFDPRSILATLT